MRGLLFGDQILTDTERKRLFILEAIREKGTLTKPEISHITRQNMPTVSKYVNIFLKNGLLLEKGLDISQGGRRPTIIELNSRAGFALGVGLSSINIVGIVANLGAEVLFKLKQRRPKTGEETKGVIKKVIKQLIKQSEVDQEKILGMGIACPSGAEVRDLDLTKEEFRREFSLPVFIENEVGLASFGESWLGVEEPVENIIYIYSLTGCGIIINGRVYRGTHQIAGRLKSAGLESLDLSAILEAKDTDRIKEVAENLGMNIAFVVDLLNPKMIIVGGGLEKMGPDFLDNLKKIIKTEVTEDASWDLEIVPSRLGEDASALGGVGLVIQNVFCSGKI